MVEEERGRAGRGTGARGAEERPCVCVGGWGSCSEGTSHPLWREKNV